MKLVLKLLLLFIVSVSLLCAVLKLCKNKENFLSPGDYPISLDKPLLYENYNVKKNSKLEKSTQDIYKNYPIFPSDSLKNNNIRYWDLPTNGQCTPPDFCMSMYNKTPQNIPPEPKNTGFEKKRVNFYNYCN
jgi:hypothetical protein